MAKAKGKVQYEKWADGQILSPKQSIVAQCYICNGEEEGTADCGCSASCPLYLYHPYNRKKVKRTMTEKQCQEVSERLKKARTIK